MATSKCEYCKYPTCKRNKSRATGHCKLFVEDVEKHKAIIEQANANLKKLRYSPGFRILAKLFALNEQVIEEYDDGYREVFGGKK